MSLEKMENNPATSLTAVENQQDVDRLVAELEQIAAHAQHRCSTLSSLDAITAIKKEYFGENALLTQLQREIRSIPTQWRSVLGKTLNTSRVTITQLLEKRREDLQRAEYDRQLQEESVDVTIHAYRHELGAIHPVNSMMYEIEDYFSHQGWHIGEGPEAEGSYYNFEALNFPPNHPARELQDTFHLISPDSGIVLRTHTSPVQIRTLLSQKPPVAAIFPGRTFRTDALDATHTPVFSQAEGLCVDRNITIAHMKATLEKFAQALFGSAIQTRMRPHFFPFTEPSYEIDIWFTDHTGRSRWVEWLGCGMVHPHVLRAVGIDPEEYTGFAFGLGIERTVQFRHGIDDMREMVEGDIRFGKMFGVDIA